MNVSKVIMRSKIFYHSITNVHYLIEVLPECMHGKYSAALFDSAELSSCFVMKTDESKESRRGCRIRGTVQHRSFFEWHQYLRFRSNKWRMLKASVFLSSFLIHQFFFFSQKMVHTITILGLLIIYDDDNILHV